MAQGWGYQGFQKGKVGYFSLLPKTAGIYTYTQTNGKRTWKIIRTEMRRKVIWTKPSWLWVLKMFTPWKLTYPVKNYGWKMKFRFRINPFSGDIRSFSGGVVFEYVCPSGPIGEAVVGINSSTQSGSGFWYIHWVRFPSCNLLGWASPIKRSFETNPAPKCFMTLNCIFLWG